jgi:hypothetical protein
MIRLNLNRHEHWIDLLPGVRLFVRPMGTAIWLSATSDDAVIAQARPATVPPEGADAPGGPMTAMDADAFSFSVALTNAVARRAILAWEGIGDLDGNAIPPSADAVAALLDLRDAHEAFCAQYLNPWLAVLDEKKGFAPLPSGISGGVPAIAAAATSGVPNAPIG